MALRSQSCFCWYWSDQQPVWSSLEWGRVSSQKVPDQCLLFRTSSWVSKLFSNTSIVDRWSCRTLQDSCLKSCFWIMRRNPLKSSLIYRTRIRWTAGPIAIRLCPCSRKLSASVGTYQLARWGSLLLSDVNSSIFYMSERRHSWKLFSFKCYSVPRLWEWSISWR